MIDIYERVKEILGYTEIAMTEDTEPIEPPVEDTEPQEPIYTLEQVKLFLSTSEAGQKWWQTEKDRHFTEQLKTWKSENISVLAEEEFNKRKIDQIVEARVMEAKIEMMEAESRAKDIKQMKMKKLADFGVKNITDTLIASVGGVDEAEITLSAMQVADRWKKEQEKNKAERFKRRETRHMLGRLGKPRY